MRVKRKRRDRGMRAEYEFDYATAVRGKYYKKLLAEGAGNVGRVVEKGREGVIIRRS